MTRDRNPSKAQPLKIEAKPEPPKKLRRPRGKYIPPRAGIEPTTPYLISPRCTALLNRRPTLRWHRLPDTNQYIVSISSPEGTIWQILTSDTQIVYPGAPALQPGTTYTITIETDTGASSRQEPDAKSLGFRVLSDAEAEPVQAAVKQAQQDWSGDPQTLAIAYAYSQHDLNAEAIECLEGAVQQGSTLLEIHQTLGHLYADMGLGAIAKKHYLKALEIVEAADDIEAQAQLLAALGDVYQLLRDREQAIEQFTQAKYSYEALGNAAAAKELDAVLANLPQTGPTYQTPIFLSQWLQNAFSAGWCSLQDLLTTEGVQFAAATRSETDPRWQEALGLGIIDLDAPETEVCQTKLIDIDSVQPLAFIVTVKPKNEAGMDEEEMVVLLQVLPSLAFLPANLELTVLDNQGECFDAIQTSHDSNLIQLKFSAPLDEGFSVKITLGKATYFQESFVI